MHSLTCCLFSGTRSLLSTNQGLLNKLQRLSTAACRLWRGIISMGRIIIKSLTIARLHCSITCAAAKFLWRRRDGNEPNAETRHHFIGRSDFNSPRFVCFFWSLGAKTNATAQWWWIAGRCREACRWISVTLSTSVKCSFIANVFQRAQLGRSRSLTAARSVVVALSRRGNHYVECSTL